MGVKVGVGVGRSRVTFKMVAFMFPAASEAERARVCAPAERPSDGTGTVWLAAALPLVRAAPSSVRVQEATPLVASETFRVTARLSPQAGQKEETPLRVTCGGWLSTLPLAVPIRELSPHDESAQSLKSFCPSRSGTSQDEPGQANVMPLRVPSMARML